MTFPFQAPTTPIAPPSPFAAFAGLEPASGSSGAPFLPNGDYGLEVTIADMVYHPAKGTSVACIETTLQVEKVLFGSAAEADKAELLTPGTKLSERREIDTPAKMSYHVNLMLAAIGVKASDKAQVAGYQAYMPQFIEAACSKVPQKVGDQTVDPSLVIGRKLTVVCNSAKKPSKGGHYIPFKTWAPV